MRLMKLIQLLVDPLMYSFSFPVSGHTSRGIPVCSERHLLETCASFRCKTYAKMSEDVQISLHAQACNLYRVSENMS